MATSRARRTRTSRRSSTGSRSSRLPAIGSASSASRELLERLGRPQDRLPPVFHVAGTNGKGSTCRLPARRARSRAGTVSMLHQPAPGPLQRADPHRRAADRGRGAGGASRRSRSTPAPGSSRASSKSRPPSRLPRLRPHASRRLHPRGRPRRPARRDQRHRASRSSPASPTSRSIISSSSATACRTSPVRKRRSPSPACR